MVMVPARENHFGRTITNMVDIKKDSKGVLFIFRIGNVR